jgi:hypothetical protein
MRHNTIATLLLVVVAGAGSQPAAAEMLPIPGGSEFVSLPGAAQPCFARVTERQTRALTQTVADCVFDNNEVRAEVFATSGPGVLAVDTTAEVKVIVSHFQVDAASDASADSYLPIHVSVPVSWAGRFFNMTGFPQAVASVNMFLRLRETSATDPNVAGPLVSQSRFQGASHGGIASCLSLPTDTVSAATALVGCALAVTEREEGEAFVELSGVIRTDQPYSIELVVRADLSSPFFTNPIDAYVPERINFSDGFGLTWRRGAVVRIGTDAEQLLSEVREEIALLKEELARLRHDFEGHYHIYLTGRGVGHNNTEARTPPPVLPDPPDGEGEAGNSISTGHETPAGAAQGTTAGDQTAGQAGAASASSGDELLLARGGGGAFGLLWLLGLAWLLTLRAGRWPGLEKMAAIFSRPR